MLKSPRNVRHTETDVTKPTCFRDPSNPLPSDCEPETVNLVSWEYPSAFEEFHKVMVCQVTNAPLHPYDIISPWLWCELLDKENKGFQVKSAQIQVDS